MFKKIFNMLNEPVKNFTYLIIVISAFTSFFSCDDDNWIRISEERVYSISGVSAFNNGWLVVHDNKKINQPRVSLLSKNNQLKDLTWPHSSLPYDLEAIHLIPNYENQYVVMESTGKCYRIIVNPDTEEIRIKGEFKLPGLSESMNLEGFANPSRFIDSLNPGSLNSPFILISSVSGLTMIL